MPETVFEALQQSASAAPDNAFIHVPRGTSYAPAGLEWTYREVLEKASALAGLFAKAGYGPGHRVALLLENRPEHLVFLFALNAVGASVVPVNPDYRHAELTYQMTHCRAVLAIALDRHVERLRAVAAETDGCFAVVDAGQVVSGLPPAPYPAEVRSLDRATEAAVFYTSGTTGRPKGCLATNDYWLSAGEWFLRLSAAGGLFSVEPGRDRLFNPMPLFHVHAGVVAIMPMLLTQGCLIRPEFFSAKRWWIEVVESGATIVHYIGVVPQALLALEQSATERAHSVRFGFGAGMEPAVHAQFEERFGFPHLEVWGMTEVGRWMANDMQPRPVGRRAIGRALAPLEARVVDEEGRPMPPNTEGELVVRLAGDDPSRGFFAGYLDDEAATERGWGGGWWHSGDVVRQDETGMIYFVDRKKNMIRRSGENVAATEVETVLSKHPAIEHVAIMAAPDERTGEEIFACIFAKPGRTPGPELARDIFGFCNEQLAYYKAPGWILFLDAMPLTATQKVSKAQIFAAGEDPTHVAGAIDCRPLKKRS